MTPTPIVLSPEDRWEIADALTRYCVALDDRRFEQLETVFTGDVTWEYEVGGIHTAGTGRDELATMLSKTLDPVPATHHSLSATQLVTPGPEAVSVRSYMSGQHVRHDSPAGHLYMIAGWFFDEFVRTPDGWRSRSRRYQDVWLDGNPAVFKR